jgi:mRNA interferase RelE/StbE
MIWTVQFVPDAARDLGKLDRNDAARILKTLESRIAAREDPRSLGAPLNGGHGGYWRWRIGDYRVIARIDDKRVAILVVRVAHRKEVYR